MIALVIGDGLQFQYESEEDDERAVEGPHTYLRVQLNSALELSSLIRIIALILEPLGSAQLSGGGGGRRRSLGGRRHVLIWVVQTTARCGDVRFKTARREEKR
jgi:hypothetical protein